MALRSNRLTPTHSHRRKRSIPQLTRTLLWVFVHGCWGVLRMVMKAMLVSPPILRPILVGILFPFLWLGFNWSYQAVHKPTEILFPLAHSLNKRPVETWRQYESLFREHATAVITPAFLAALAQVESGGNPVARTYWRWQLSWNPLEWYRPASSAVGMYQLTDGTFREAKRYCIHDHAVVEDGPWYDWHSCWFNSLYMRIIPSHAIELTAAWLDRRVAQAIGQRPPGAVTLQQKQDLAAVIHLCGAGAGRAFAARDFKLTSRQQCGDHDVSGYLARVNALKHAFAKPAAGDKTIRQAR